MLAKMKARAAVAKTSKKPSTQRCTTHQRQYSMTERCVRAPKKKPAAYMRPMAALAPVNIRTSGPSRRPWPARAGHEPAQHQDEPQHEPGEEGDLPGAAEVHVLVALVAEPEARVEAELLVDGQPLAGERPDHDEEQRAEQDVHAQTLEPRLAPADGRRQEEAGGQERRRDPEHPSLDVPGPGEAVGQVLSQREAVEAPVPRRCSARSRCPGRTCTTKSATTTADVLGDGAHRRRQGEAAQRVARRAA